MLKKILLLGFINSAAFAGQVTTDCPDFLDRYFKTKVYPGYLKQAYGSRPYELNAENGPKCTITITHVEFSEFTGDKYNVNILIESRYKMNGSYKFEAFGHTVGSLSGEITSNYNCHIDMVDDCDEGTHHVRFQKVSLEKSGTSGDDEFSALVHEQWKKGINEVDDLIRDELNRIFKKEVYINEFNNFLNSHVSTLKDNSVEPSSEWES